MKEDLKKTKTRRRRRLVNEKMNYEEGKVIRTRVLHYLGSIHDVLGKLV